MKTKHIIISLILLMIGGCVMEDSVQDQIAEVYENKEKLIHAYPDDSKSEYLSESLGLYMEYLAAIKDEKNFQIQYDRLIQYYLDKKEQAVFIRWRLGDTHTNALIDDNRIISSLYNAGREFNDERYTELAHQLKHVLKTQESDGYTTDFYDWQLGLAADRVTLSYLSDNSLVTPKTIELLKKVKAEDVFFPEYFDIKANKYISNNEVHMIDQLLIAINRENIGEPSPLFEEWVTNEWNSTHMIFGRYERGSLVPQVKYESLAVYYYLYEYFKVTGKDQLAKDVKKHTENLADGDVLKEAHFFDFIHYQLLLIN